MAASAPSRRWRKVAALATLAAAVVAQGPRKKALPGCADNRSFRDAWNETCADWRHDNCFAAMEWYEYSLAEQDQVLQHCPDSCGVCRLQERERE